MYRFRFEKLDQLFEVPEKSQIVLPVNELLKSDVQALLQKYAIIAEIPSILWENDIKGIKEKLGMLKEQGVKDAICENVGAINICKELGLTIHGGMYLNILNSVSFGLYSEMGAEDLTLSFEMPFKKQRIFLSEKDKKGIAAKAGIAIYGYLPLMKFRSCPAMGEKGCKGCTRDKMLTDRKGEKFRIICRNSKYSELLNSVPLYCADKSVPNTDFQLLYFTTEEKDECKKIFNMVLNKEVPGFRRTSGLYGRDLL